MAIQQWLERGAIFPDGSLTRKLNACGDEWQIYSTSFDGFVLMVTPSLFSKWESAELMDKGLFGTISVGEYDYRIFTGKRGYMISSIQSGPYPTTPIEAMAFAISLRETREISRGASFHDALYMEQISRLLPTYTHTERVDDPTVLGTWLSAGVSISTNSFRRLCTLLEWMDSREVEKIITAAGFNRSEPEQTDSASLSRGGRFSLGGRNYLEDFFNEHIVEIVKNEEKYKKMGVEFPSAIVLHGPPGCGKTYAVDKLVEFLDWPSFSINSGSIGSPYIHETSKKIADIFDKAMENAPSVIVIDEMEAFLTDRSIGQASGLNHVEEVAEFLRRIPTAVQNKVLVIAMTNMIDKIDPAILRRGRFDHVLEVKMPSNDEIEKVLRKLLFILPVSNDINIKVAVVALKGRPLSDVAFAVKEAGRMTVKQNKEVIDNAALLTAIEWLPEMKSLKSEKLSFENQGQLH